MNTIYEFENKPPYWTPPPYTDISVDVVSVRLQTNTDPDDPNCDEMVVTLRIKEEGEV